MGRVLVVSLVFACGGGEPQERETTASTVQASAMSMMQATVSAMEASAASTMEPTPVESPTTEAPAEPVDGRLDAHRMRGPARSLCGVVRRLTESSDIDCDLVSLRERDEDLLDVRSSMEPEGPWLAVHFAEIRFDANEIDSNCALLVRTSAGWFGHDLDDKLCNNSGSVRVSVGANMRWEPIGPDGAKRLVVEVTESMGHFVDGNAEVEDTLVCGENEGRVSCLFMRSGASYSHGPASEGELPPDWDVDLTLLSGDRLRVGEHMAPDLPRKPPDAGTYEIRF